jgi:hypothetical protein
VAIDRRGTPVVFTANSTSAALAVTIPAGVQTGDLAAVLFGQANGAVLTLPTGWILVGTQSNTTVNQTTLAVRALTAADAGTSHSFGSASTTRMVAILAVLTGVDVSNLAGGSHLAAAAVGRTQTTSTARTSSSVTPTVAGAYLLFGHTERSASAVVDTTYTPDAASNWNGQGSSTSASATNAAGGLYGEALTTAAGVPSGTRAPTSNKSNGATVLTVALAPASVAASGLPVRVATGSGLATARLKVVNASGVLVTPGALMTTP